MATILVVDDRPVERGYLTTLLGYAGHRLLEAGDGEEGLRLAKQHRPDLIISDLLMPHMDGFEFVRLLRAEEETRPIGVVFYTASYLQHEAQKLAEACGVRHILLKPCEPQTVLETVGEALGEQAATLPDIPPEEFHHQHVQLVVGKLSQKLDEVIPRLASLIAVGQDLMAEAAPERLMQKFCHLARDVIGAKYCSTVLLDGGQASISGFYYSGLDDEAARKIGHPPELRGLLAEMLNTNTPLRMADIAAHPRSVGFPAYHPAMRSFLGAPILSPAQRFGFVYMCDKVGVSEFSEEDEELIATLAAQVAVAYENALRRHEIEQLNAQLEQRVRDRTAELEVANRELESFSYSVSHDLRAPLRSINGFGQMLRDGYAADLPPDAVALLDKVINSARQMDGLITDLLAFSRVGRGELNRQPVKLRQIVEAVLEDLKSEQGDRPVEIEIRELPDCHADPAMIRQVYANLLHNALKYTRGRTLARIEVGSQEQDGRQVYFVRDNGVGFDMQYADRLFGVFQRLHRASEFEGTGVGLATVQRIIHRHGGRIWAEAEPDQGAAFYFTLTGEG